MKAKTELSKMNVKILKHFLLLIRFKFPLKNLIFFFYFFVATSIHGAQFVYAHVVVIQLNC